MEMGDVVFRAVGSRRIGGCRIESQNGSAHILHYEKTITDDSLAAYCTRDDNHLLTGGDTRDGGRRRCYRNRSNTGHTQATLRNLVA